MRRPLIDEWSRQWGLPAAVHRLEQSVTDILLSPRTGDVEVTQVFAGGGSSSGGGGATDHGALTGLADDDHPQYATDTDLTTHAAAADPHTVYLKESDTNYLDLTDGGATTLHSHAGGGGGTSLGLTMAVAAGAYLT